MIVLIFFIGKLDLYLFIIKKLYMHEDLYDLDGIPLQPNCMVKLKHETIQGDINLPASSRYYEFQYGRNFIYYNNLDKYVVIYPIYWYGRKKFVMSYVEYTKSRFDRYFSYGQDLRKRKLKILKYESRS